MAERKLVMCDFCGTELKVDGEVALPQDWIFLSVHRTWRPTGADTKMACPECAVLARGILEGKKPELKAALTVIDDLKRDNLELGLSLNKTKNDVEASERREKDLRVWKDDLLEERGTLEVKLTRAKTMLEESDRTFARKLVEARYEAQVETVKTLLHTNKRQAVKILRVGLGKAKAKVSAK